MISSDLQQSNLASWITTSYLLTSTAIQPLYGRFSDIFGRRACLLMATAVFGLGCLGCACSTDMTTLIMMRALAGLGGGGLMTMSKFICLGSYIETCSAVGCMWLRSVIAQKQQQSSIQTSFPRSSEASTKLSRISSMAQALYAVQPSAVCFLTQSDGASVSLDKFPWPWLACALRQR